MNCSMGAWHGPQAQRRSAHCSGRHRAGTLAISRSALTAVYMAACLAHGSVIAQGFQPEGGQGAYALAQALAHVVPDQA